MNLLRWFTFLLGSMTVTVSLALLDLFLSFATSICSIMTFPPLGNSDHVLSQFPLTFHQTQNGIPLFII